LPDTNITANAFATAARVLPLSTSSSLPGALLSLGLSGAALAYAGVEVQVVGRDLRARHRGADGGHLGWEVVVPPRDPAERPRYYYHGTAKGLFRTPPGRCERLVLSDGSLPSLLRLSHDLAVGRGVGTCYAAAGGSWTSVAEAALEALLRRGRISVVELDFGPHANGRTAEARVLVALARHPRVDVARHGLVGRP
jgi:hypothetical protein